MFQMTLCDVADVKTVPTRELVEYLQGSERYLKRYSESGRYLDRVEEDCILMRAEVERRSRLADPEIKHFVVEVEMFLPAPPIHFVMADKSIDVATARARKCVKKDKHIFDHHQTIRVFRLEEWMDKRWVG